MRILVTRPLPDAERTIGALRERGHEVIHAPILRIEALRDAVIGAGPWDAVLITSANAVRAIEGHPRFRDLLLFPVIAVGARTASAAKAAGFLQASSADGDESALLERVKTEFRDRPARFLYLAGEDRAGDIAGELSRAGHDVETAVVYRAAAAGDLGPEATKALRAGAIDAALHYSPRSAELFLKALEKQGLAAEAARLAHLCLSEQVAAPLRAAGAEKIAVAPRPNEESLLELVHRA